MERLEKEYLGEGYEEKNIEKFMKQKENVTFEILTINGEKQKGEL